MTERLCIIRLETITFLQKIDVKGHERASFNFFLGYPPNVFHHNGPIISESDPLSKPGSNENGLQFGKFMLIQKDERGAVADLQLQRNHIDSNVSRLEKLALVVKTEKEPCGEDDMLLKLGCRAEDISKVKTYKNEKIFLANREVPFSSFINTIRGETWTAKVYPLFTIQPKENHHLALDVEWSARFGLIHQRMIPLSSILHPVFHAAKCGIIDEVNVTNNKFQRVKKVLLTTEEEIFPTEVRSHFDGHGAIKDWDPKEAGGHRFVEVSYKSTESADSAVRESVKNDGIAFPTGKVFCLSDYKVSKQSKKRGPTSPLPVAIPPTRPRTDEEQTLVQQFRSSVSTEEQRPAEQEPTAGPSGVSSSSVAPGHHSTDLEADPSRDAEEDEEVFA